MSQKSAKSVQSTTPKSITRERSDRRPDLPRTKASKIIRSPLRKRAITQAVLAEAKKDLPATSTTPSLASRKSVENLIDELSAEVDRYSDVSPRPSEVDHFAELKIGGKTEDEWSDVDSVCSGRSSMLPQMSRGVGASMDLATKRANELLLSGKEALEKAGNMKRESKTEALACLQELYEIALSLSDSRSRHKLAAETERKKAAKELVRVERAHTKQVADILTTHASKLRDCDQTLQGIQELVKSTWSWLNFELDGPMKVIADIKNHITKNQTTPCPSSDQITRQDLAAVKEHLSDLKAHSIKMDSLRVEVSNIHSSVNSLTRQLEPRPPGSPVSAHQNAPSLEIPPNLLDPLTRGLDILKDRIDRLQTGPLEKIEELQSGPTQLQITRTDVQEDLSDAVRPLKQQLKTITEAVEEIRLTGPIELTAQREGMREDIGSQVALTEIRDRLTVIEKKVQAPQIPQKQLNAPRENNTVTPRPVPGIPGVVVTPKHTLLIESADPRMTGQNIIDKIKDSIDVVQMGVGVTGLRRCSGGKVAITLNTSSEMGVMRSAIKELSQQLTVKTPKQKHPLLRLIGVTPDISDTRIIEAVENQNRDLLSTLPKDNIQIRVVRRTKGRNSAVQNVILEVTPAVWGALRDRRLRVGYQIVPALDQSPILQCYRCLGFAHRARDCRAPEIKCGYCTGVGHDTRDCPVRGGAPSCTNCLGNKKVSDKAHPAYSSSCPEWIKWDKLARNTVSYC